GGGAACGVTAGAALAVDRERFARGVTEAIESLPNVRIVREEVRSIPEEGPCIVATGPLASEAIAAAIARFTGREYLYFFDAISPIVEADTIDMSKVFRASRYGKGGEDYLNCPLSEGEYDRFHAALLGAAEAPTHEFEKEIVYFEGCLPIEEMARRGCPRADLPGAPPPGPVLRGTNFGRRGVSRVGRVRPHRRHQRGPARGASAALDLPGDDRPRRAVALHLLRRRRPLSADQHRL